MGIKHQRKKKTKKKLRIKFTRGTRKRVPFPGMLFICLNCKKTRFCALTAEYISTKECYNCGGKEHSGFEVTYGEGGKLTRGTDKEIKRGRIITPLPEGTYYLPRGRVVQQLTWTGNTNPS